MDSNDPVIKKTELVVEALSYAKAHSLDIRNSADVKRTIEVIDPEHSGEEEVAEFMKLLQAANSLIEKDAERRRITN